MAKFTDHIRGFDRFGNSFSLNFKGKETQQTLCGGFFSIIGALFVFYYSLLKLNIVYNRLDPAVSFNSVQHQAESMIDLSARDNHFEITFGMFEITPEGNSNILFEWEKYFSVNVFVKTQTINGPNVSTDFG